MLYKCLVFAGSSRIAYHLSTSFNMACHISFSYILCNFSYLIGFINWLRPLIITQCATCKNKLNLKSQSLFHIGLLSILNLQQYVFFSSSQLWCVVNNPFTTPLIATVVRNFFSSLHNHSQIGNEMSFQTSRFANVRSQIKQIIMGNCHPLEVVGRGSETQLQVDENLN